jgi:hypothetical protein
MMTVPQDKRDVSRVHMASRDRGPFQTEVILKSTNFYKKLIPP